MVYNKENEQEGIKIMKVWCFNCYGVCVAYLRVGDIPKWNEIHRIYSKKIVDWKE